MAYLAGVPALVAVVLGFKRNLWIVVFVLLAHGLFDLVHGYLIVKIRRAGAPSTCSMRTRRNKLVRWR